MTDRPPSRAFGKRGPVSPRPPQPGPKRSGHVTLLVMGTLAVGGGAYALMGSESCAPQPASPGMAAPAVPQASSACASRGSSGGGYSRGSSFSFYSGDSAGRASSATASDSASGGVTRGGFGSLARAFGFGGG